MKQSLADIVKAVDGDKIFQGCGLGLKQCSEALPCPIHHEFKRMRKQLFQMLERAKVGTFTSTLENSLAFLKR
jgi:DNA-binding IscR family transcriptional regulator